MDDRTSDNYADSKPGQVEDWQPDEQRTPTAPLRKGGFERKDVSALIAELIGCFVFIFLGAGSIIANTWAQGAVGLMGIASAHGLALAVLITIFGATSGGHFNPAVTVAFLIARRIKPVLGLCYIVVQLAGGVLGALVLSVVFPTAVWKSAQLGTPGLSNGVTVGGGIAIEALLTFFLLLAIYGTAVDSRTPRFGGFCIGLAVLAGILGGGVLTGAAMNPMLAFGPALISGVWTNQLVYWIGPIVGAVLAACIYEYLILPPSEEEEDSLDQDHENGESVVPQQVKERNLAAKQTPLP